MAESEVIAGLDIGSDSIRVLVAEYSEKGELIVSGWGETRSEGLRKGVVVNIEAAREAVIKAVEAAEHEAGRTVTELWCSLGGSAVSSMHSRGVVAVSGKNREINQLDVDRVLEAAKAVVIPMDRDILHVLPQEYIIDDQRGVRNPLDMIGVRLEAEVLIVTASLSALKNLEKAVERADYRIGDAVLGTLASARALLTEDEKELGVLLVDIGANSTDFILIKDGAPRFSASVPLGGSIVTSDISIVLKTSAESAEHIKINSGTCWVPLAEKDGRVIVPGVGGREPVTVSSEEVAAILQARMEEIFYMIKKQISGIPGLSPLHGGVVLCGGGSLLKGSVELATDVFGFPARMGKPGGNIQWPPNSSNSKWAAAAGLIMLGDAVRRGSGERDTAGMFSEKTNIFNAFFKWLREFF